MGGLPDQPVPLLKRRLALSQELMLWSEKCQQGWQPTSAHWHVRNSDQGCQLTSGDFVARLQGEEIKISWSGRKRCHDNILVERLWRTVKYVAKGFSAKPSRGVPALLQRWLGG